MKLSLAAAAAIIQLASAHYFFDMLTVDGKASSPNQYVRANTRQAKYNPTKWVNIRDDMTPDLPDFRCNKGAFSSASKTQTAAVKPGSKLAMKLAVGADFQHPGPRIVYMSKAPTTAQAYEGDGDWFKIYEDGICDKSDIKTTSWCSWKKNNVEFSIPAGTPDGEYLIRAEHIGVHGAHAGQAEFYYSCAQVKVTGGGSGPLPTDTIKFPGGYKKTDPSFNFSIWGGFKDYPMPGPKVWKGGATQSKAIEAAAPATSAAPVAAAPVDAEEDEDTCSESKPAARGRRAFRETLRSEASL